MKGTEKDEIRKKKHMEGQRKRLLDIDIREEHNFRIQKKRQDMIKICNADPNSEHCEKYLCPRFFSFFLNIRNVFLYNKIAFTKCLNNI